jgi:site-specific recombinase XerD
MPDPDLADLAESWLVHLRAERKSPSTLRIYRAGVKAYLTWCAENGQPAILDRNLLASFTADLLDRGAELATAQARHLAVRRFGRWLHAEGELAEDPLAGMRPPKLDTKVIPVLSDDELRRLVKACEGRTLRDRRDEAIIRLMLESGLRAGEVVALRTEDVDVGGGTLVVRRGKGGSGRLVPFSAQTARALDRYLATAPGACPGRRAEPVAGRELQPSRLRRPVCGAPQARPAGRDPEVLSAHAAAHRGEPVVGGRGL